jgi:hypothetical protein
VLRGRTATFELGAAPVKRAPIFSRSAKVILRTAGRVRRACQTIDIVEVWTRFSPCSRRRPGPPTHCAIDLFLSDG